MDEMVLIVGTTGKAFPPGIIIYFPRLRNSSNDCWWFQLVFLHDILKRFSIFCQHHALSRMQELFTKAMICFQRIWKFLRFETKELKKKWEKIHPSGNFQFFVPSSPPPWCQYPALSKMKKLFAKVITTFLINLEIFTIWVEQIKE